MAKEGNITITNMVYGLGAAIVIVGALFKIQHWPFGSEILTIGMIVEAGVFTYSAFERVKGKGVSYGGVVNAWFGKDFSPPINAASAVPNTNGPTESIKTTNNNKAYT